MHYGRSIFINYVSKYQLSHAVNVSYTTPTTHVNWGRMLFEINWWRHCLCFKWVSCILETKLYISGAESGRTVRYSIHEQYIHGGMSVIPRNPAVEPSISCATCILGPHKIQMLSHFLIFSFWCKLFNVIVI